MFRDSVVLRNRRRAPDLAGEDEVVQCTSYCPTIVNAPQGVYGNLDRACTVLEAR